MRDFFGYSLWRSDISRVPKPIQDAVKALRTVANTITEVTIKTNFSTMDLMKIAEEAFAGEKKEFPAFAAGDQITVAYRIKEGNKERIQEFRGDVITIHGSENKKRFTVRKMSGNVGVERIFPMDSPFIERITVNKYGKVRRAKLYYLRNLTGKKARIPERRVK